MFTCLYPQDTIQFLGESPHRLSPRLWGLIKIILCLQAHSRRRLLSLGTSHSFSFIVFPDFDAPIFSFHEYFYPIIGCHFCYFLLVVTAQMEAHQSLGIFLCLLSPGALHLTDFKRLIFCSQSQRRTRECLVTLQTRVHRLFLQTIYIFYL